MAYRDLLAHVNRGCYVAMLPIDGGLYFFIEPFPPGELGRHMRLPSRMRGVFAVGFVTRAREIVRSTLG